MGPFRISTKIRGDIRNTGDQGLFWIFINSMTRAIYLLPVTRPPAMKQLAYISKVKSKKKAIYECKQQPNLISTKHE
jgi:hypothetical protein